MTNPDLSYLPLIQTKLHRPPLPIDLVHRPRLIDFLNHRQARPLLLISAPAGYGKSTLAKCWVESQNCPAAWISLDEHDDNLFTFLSYFLAAVQTNFPDVGHKTQELLNSTLQPPVSVIATSLINELTQIERPFILVLDDYHQVHSDSIHELLTQLLLHPPPTMHLVLCTRLDPPLPLVKLRARGLVSEVRAQGLRFNKEEVDILLQNMLGSGFDDATISKLEEQTEGWVTGLRLAAFALRQESGRNQVQDKLTVNNRYVAEYLVQEILSQQIAVYSECMLKISVLERFTAEACQTICFQNDKENGTESHHGKAFLDWLVSSNLFIVHLDEHTQWFRFHHLFREFLFNELHRRFSSAEINKLYTSASKWFEQNEYIEEALQYAFSANDTEQAIHLIASKRFTLMNQAQWHLLAQNLTKFPPEVVNQSPELLVVKMWLSYHHGHWELLPREVEQIEELLEHKNMDSRSVSHLEGELCAVRSLLCFRAVKPDDSIKNAQESIAKTHPELWIVRVLARICLAGSLQMKGDLNGAYQIIYDGLNEEQIKTDHAKATLIQTACRVHWVAADLHGMIQAAEQCIALSQSAKTEEILGFGRTYLGTALYHQNDLAVAAMNFNAVILKPYQNYGINLADSFCGLGFIYQAQDQPEKAQQVVEEAVKFFMAAGSSSMLFRVQALQAEIALRQGKTNSAIQWARQFTSLSAVVPLYHFYAPQLTLVKVYLAQDTHSSRTQASELLDELYTFLTDTHNTRFAMEVLALKALLADQIGDKTSALDLLGQTLEMAEPGGFFRLFLDMGPPMIKLLRQAQNQGLAQAFIGRILSAGKIPPTHHPANGLTPPGIPLTERESEILSLLAQRLSNKEIAARLSITPGTVKQHISHIFEKFGATNRREAVSKAIDLGIYQPDQIR